MVNMRYISIFVILTGLLSTSSCGTRVIKRSRDGNLVRQNSKQQFSGIKKKVALLKFFNEAPYGGEDLAVTATEELRRELARTGEFIVDPMVKKIFGNSKEIYSGGGVKLVQLARKAKIAGLHFAIFGRIVEARIRERTDEIGVVRETKSYTEAKVEVRILMLHLTKKYLPTLLKVTPMIVPIGSSNLIKNKICPTAATYCDTPCVWQ